MATTELHNHKLTFVKATPTMPVAAANYKNSYKCTSPDLSTVTKPIYHLPTCWTACNQRLRHALHKTQHCKNNHYNDKHVHMSLKPANLHPNTPQKQQRTQLPQSRALASGLVHHQCRPVLQQPPGHPCAVQQGSCTFALVTAASATVALI